MVIHLIIEIVFAFLVDEEINHMVQQVIFIVVLWRADDGMHL